MVAVDARLFIGWDRAPPLVLSGVSMHPKARAAREHDPLLTRHSHTIHYDIPGISYNSTYQVELF